MKPKMILSIVLSVGLNVIVSAQTLKTFNGEYDDGTVNKGKATYTYYVDKGTMNYVKHGAFKFTYTDKDEISLQKVSISGNYKHNKRDGIWSFIISLNDWPTNGDGYITGSKTLTATYVNGKPNGAWVYKYNVKKREKRYSLVGYTWTPYSSIPSEYVTATFSDGALTGPIRFINSPPYSEYSSIVGQFGSNGLMVGTWIYKSPDKEKIIAFKNGILVSFIVRENGSGRITSKDVDEEAMTRMKNDFLGGKISAADLSRLKIKVDTIDAVKNTDYDFSQSFKSSDFRFKYIPGDESYNYRQSIYNEDTYKYTQESGWVDIRNEGKFYIFTQTSTYKLSELKEFNTANDYFASGDYQEAQKIFEQINSKYKENLEGKDLAWVQLKIVECKAGIEKNQRASKAHRLYESISYIQQWSSDKSALDNLDTLLVKYSDVFNTNELADIQKQHDKIQQKLENIETESRESAKIKRNRDLMNSRHAQIIELYKVTGDEHSGYSASKKSRLFRFYNDIYMNFSNQISTNYDRKKLVEISTLLVTVQNKMIKLVDIDSKDIEKRLKAAETIDERAKIFIASVLSNP